MLMEGPYFFPSLLTLISAKPSKREISIFKTLLITENININQKQSE